MEAPTLNTLLPQGHKILTYNHSEQYATAADNLHTLKKAIHRAGYDKGYERGYEAGRQDAEAITDANVEALLQMGRDLGWKEATGFTTSERTRLLDETARNDQLVDCPKLATDDEPIRVVHWFGCAKKCVNAAKAKVAKAKAKARGGEVAREEEKEWFGFCGR